MPKMKSKRRKNKTVLARTKPASVERELEIVTQLNNNVSIIEPVDEILLESFEKEDAGLHEKDPVSSETPSDSKKRVKLQSSGRVVKHLKYWGSKFEIKHDTISLDKFFIRKTLRSKKREKSKVVYIKSDDDEITFKVTKKQLDRNIQDNIKDEVESKEINDENSMEDLKDVIDDLFPDENYDIEVKDLDNILSVKNSLSDEETNLETELETAFELLEIFLQDSRNQEMFQQLELELEEDYRKPHKIQLTVDTQPSQQEEEFLVREAGHGPA